MKKSFFILFCLAHGLSSCSLKVFSEQEDSPDFSQNAFQSGPDSMERGLSKENKGTQDSKAPDSVKIKTSPGENSSSSKVITSKIKSVFEDFIKVLENQSVESEEYRKAVKFLENSLYNTASFESLKLLAQVYEDKKDFTNQLNVLKVLSASSPNNPESFYLLAMGYKNQYLNREKEEQTKSVLKEMEKYKQLIIENLNKALKLDSKHIPSYSALLDLLMITNPKTDEKQHTKASLSVVLDMWKNLKQNKYYIPLCKAYYDNRFFKQSLRACARSVKKNPKDPLSPLILSLSLSDEKKKEEKLILTAQTFPDSFFVQYKTGLYFEDKSPRSAILYLTSAQKLQTKHVKLNKKLAQFLFDNGEEERSYDYFLNSCLITDGLFLENFRRAKSSLRRKSKVDLVLKFQKGIQECYQTVKKRKREKS